LDIESDVNEVALAGGIEELRKRLEILLGASPEAPIDESARRESEIAAERNNRREKLATSGGQLLSAAFQFIGELYRNNRNPNPQQQRLHLSQRH
jgi:hypothetical protein